MPGQSRCIQNERRLAHRLAMRGIETIQAAVPPTITAKLSPISTGLSQILENARWENV